MPLDLHQITFTFGEQYKIQAYRLVLGQLFMHNTLFYTFLQMKENIQSTDLYLIYQPVDNSYINKGREDKPKR